jgi:pimeloyl-ACP methyl ester carboxylesterase
VFMTQCWHRDWAMIALSRGYIGCIYGADDARDDTDTFVDAYPEYDWSRLTRRAWAAGRCIDYLATMREADTDRVALTGHSRNGKQSLIAAALDERIAVVISSSSGAGGSAATRFASEQHASEGIELLTRVFPDWFHPRLRFFVGREHKLPVDLHELVALSAPRACLLSTALNDGVESTWATQQTYLAVQRVYRLLGAEENLALLWRSGSHETNPTLIERYLDWCDYHLRDGHAQFASHFVYPCDWEAWRAESGERVQAAEYPPRELEDAAAMDDGSPVQDVDGWVRKKKQVRERVRWVLGNWPPAAVNPGASIAWAPSHIAAMLGREPAPYLEQARLAFGEHLSGDVYMPVGLRERGSKSPAILWLHPFSFPSGYVAPYCRDRGGPSGGQVFRALALAGFTVFCYDQIGFGQRVSEAERFYERYPHWSLLGKMVQDAQAALDVLTRLPYVDAERVFGVGYALGCLVGLHLGAVDERLAGLASVCGPQPLRLDTPERATGGIRRWSHQYMLVPRLGFWADDPQRVLYDVPELLACFAPRPVLVVSPQLDRDARLEDVTRAVQAARRLYDLYGAGGLLEHLAPEDYNHFGPSMQGPVIEWLKRRSGV